MERAMKMLLIHEVQEISERLDTIKELLLPDGDAELACPHPADRIEVEEFMGEPPKYHCTVCGKTQDTPFHSQE